MAIQPTAANSGATPFRRRPACYFTASLIVAAPTSAGYADPAESAGSALSALSAVSAGSDRRPSHPPCCR